MTRRNVWITHTAQTIVAVTAIIAVILLSYWNRIDGVTAILAVQLVTGASAGSSILVQRHNTPRPRRRPPTPTKEPDHV